MISESYGINIKSIYNDYLESILFINSSYYNYGRVSFPNYVKQNLRHFQLNLIYSPNNFTKFKIGSYYSSSWGLGKINRYRSRLGFETKFANNLKFNIDYDYALKFIGTEKETNSNSFIKASFNYIME